MGLAAHDSRRRLRQGRGQTQALLDPYAEASELHLARSRDKQIPPRPIFRFGLRTQPRSVSGFNPRSLATGVIPRSDSRANRTARPAPQSDTSVDDPSSTTPFSQTTRMI